MQSVSGLLDLTEHPICLIVAQHGVPVPSVGDELEAVREQLNVIHIDRVVEHLR